MKATILTALAVALLAGAALAAGSRSNDRKSPGSRPGGDVRLASVMCGNG